MCLWIRQLICFITHLLRKRHISFLGPTQKLHRTASSGLLAALPITAKPRFTKASSNAANPGFKLYFRPYRANCILRIFNRRGFLFSNVQHCGPHPRPICVCHCVYQHGNSTFSAYTSFSNTGVQPSTLRIPHCVFMFTNTLSQPFCPHIYLHVCPTFLFVCLPPRWPNH